MAEAENLKIVEFAHAALATGDRRPYHDLLADNVRWTVMGTTAWSRTWVGKTSVLSDLFGELRSQFVGDEIRVTAQAFYADGDLVAVEGKGHNRTRSGRAYENEYCWIYELSNGKVTDVVQYSDTDLIARVLEAPKR
jgi:ketosteroid isomerase-like protein